MDVVLSELIYDDRKSVHACKWLFLGNSWMRTVQYGSGNGPLKVHTFISHIYHTTYLN